MYWIVFKMNLKSLFTVSSDCYWGYDSFLQMFCFQVILTHMGREIQCSSEVNH